MIRLRHKVLIHAFLLIDQLMLISTAAAIIYLRPEVKLTGGPPMAHATFRLIDTFAMLLLAVGWIGIFHYCIRYKADRFVAFKVQLKDLIKATTLASFWLVIISAVFSVKSFNTSNILLFWAAVTMIGVASRVMLRVMLMSARRSGYNYRFLLVIGANQRGLDLAKRIEARPELGYKLVGFVAESPDARQTWQNDLSGHGGILGNLDELQTILKRERVDEMMVCLPLEARFSDIAMIIQHARDLGVVARLVPDVADTTMLKSLYIEQFEGDYVLTLFRERMLLQLLMKRLVDASASIMALVVLSPLMLAVALVIKLTSPGPVLFAQNRVGMNQRQFRLYKFRSMVIDAEARKSELQHLNERDGPAFKIENDPRITPIGRFIRKMSIDELPQLFNVLRGEMSLVGPRPPLPDEVKLYEWLFRKRLSVKPGITCVWQVTGRNNTSFEKWMEMDHEYVENWSLWLDFKILLQTVPAVLFSRGAS